MTELNYFEIEFSFHPKIDPDSPGKTFRVLKEKEEKQYGEYRTRHLVLERCIANVGILFRDNDHWQRVMRAYMQGVLPQSFKY